MDGYIFKLKNIFSASEDVIHYTADHPNTSILFFQMFVGFFCSILNWTILLIYCTLKEVQTSEIEQEPYPLKFENSKYYVGSSFMF
jgi:hypothetical protein